MAKQTKRMDGAEREKTILDAGAKLAAKHGAVNVTRKMVAEAAKTSPALVAHYAGNNSEAQKAYRRHMKKLGLVEPPKEKIEAIGVKMRAHGPRKAPVIRRKRSAKEVQAIKKAVAKKVVKAPAKKSSTGARGAARVAKVTTTPAEVIAAVPQPVAVNVPQPVAKKQPAKKAVTAARAPLPPPVGPGSESVN